jgi:phosphohistidine phosphatase
MKTLLMLRHARSILKSQNLSDHARPLDELAKQDALDMGKLLRNKDLIPDLIISSTALRAKTTAELVAKGGSYQGEIVLEQSLYQAKPKDYLKIIQGLSEKYTCVLLVGHNPTLEETIGLLAGSSGVKMTPCALAPLNISIEKWSDFKFNDKQENNAGAELIRNVVLAGIITPRVWGLGS